MLMGILGHIGNPEENNDELARSIVEQLKEALPPGGHLALYEAINIVPAYNDAIRTYSESGAVPYHLRSPSRSSSSSTGLNPSTPASCRSRSGGPTSTQPSSRKISTPGVV